MAPGAIQNTSTPASERLGCSYESYDNSLSQHCIHGYSMNSGVSFAPTESDKHDYRHRRGADLPEWVFSAASCLARKATAALLMPSANLMPADDMKIVGACNTAQ